MQALQELGAVRVIRVNERNPLAARLIQTLVACRRHAGVLLIVEQADAGVGGVLQELANHLRGTIRGTVNHYQQLKVGVGLCQNGLHRGDDSVSGVIDRHDNAGAG